MSGQPGADAEPWDRAGGSPVPSTGHILPWVLSLLVVVGSEVCLQPLVAEVLGCCSQLADWLPVEAAGMIQDPQWNPQSCPRWFWGHHTPLGFIAKDEKSAVLKATKACDSEAICHTQPSNGAKTGRKTQNRLPNTRQCSDSKSLPQARSYTSVLRSWEKCKHALDTAKK